MIRQFRALRSNGLLKKNNAVFSFGGYLIRGEVIQSNVQKNRPPLLNPQNTAQLLGLMVLRSLITVKHLEYNITLPC